MGNESVVLWLSAELAMGYFGAVVVGMLGVVQVVAVRHGREELRWMPTPLALPLGTLLALGALLCFYVTFYELIFVPGPAGLELILLFGGGTALALWTTRLLHRLSATIAPGAVEP